MTIFLHEMKRNRLSVLIWTAALSMLLLMCVLLYPLMEPIMNDFGQLTAEMAGMSGAVDMDALGLGSFDGYFTMECGEMLGLGGALFAAILGIGALAKEERDRTGEFLLTHPVSRGYVVRGKLVAVMVQITFLNVMVVAINTLGILAIGEEEYLKNLWLVFVSYYLLQLQIAAVTFGLSAFLRKGALPIGFGIGFFFYVLYIIANITEKTKFLKYVTPFSYCEGSLILDEQNLAWKYVAVGGAMAVAAVILAFRKYQRKDIIL